MSSSPVFVRCLKPNHLKVPGKFDETYIHDQVRNKYTTICLSKPLIWMKANEYLVEYKFLTFIVQRCDLKSF